MLFTVNININHYCFKMKKFVQSSKPNYEPLLKENKPINLDFVVAFDKQRYFYQSTSNYKNIDTYIPSIQFILSTNNVEWWLYTDEESREKDYERLLSDNPFYY